MSRFTVTKTDPMLRIKSWVRTCHACPAQWDGETEDGRGVYIRYRGGSGYLTVADSPRKGADVFGPTVLEWEGDHPLDGYMSEQELRDLFPEVQWPE